MASLLQSIAKHHYQAPHWLGTVCLPLAWGYGLISQIRNTLYDFKLLPSTPVSIPVICVGNLTTGGTGKTPVIIALAEYFTEQGLKVGVLSRGYGGKKTPSGQRVTSPTDGDEAFLIQEAVPQAIVLVGQDRVKSAQVAVQTHQVDLLLLDDGFQHRRLKRDLDIVLIDAERGLGNEQLLPVGPLRESISGIKRAHQLWLVSKQPDKQPDQPPIPDWFSRLQPFCKNLHTIATVAYQPVGIQAFTNGAQTQPTLEKPAAFTNAPIVLLSGIANPTAFEHLVTALGIPFLTHHQYPDHHTYTAQELETLLQRYPQNTCWLTTDKDRVKLAPLIPASQQSQLFSLTVKPIISPDLLEREPLIQSLLQKKRRSQSSSPDKGASLV